MNPHNRYFFGLCVLGMVLGWVIPGWAGESDQGTSSLDSSAGIFLVRHQDTESLVLEQDYPAYIKTALERAFAAFAITNQKTITVSTGLTLEQIGALCQEEQVRWGIMVMTTMQDGLFSWYLGIYDGEMQYFRSYDSFATYVETGIFTTQIIDSAVEKIVKNWHDSLSSRWFDGKVAVTQGQRFMGNQDGVKVLFGSQDHFLEGGVIMNGVLTTAFHPFTQGVPLQGTLVKDRYWPRSFELPQGITDTTVLLPALQRKTRHSLGFGYEFRGDFFACLDMEYRFHILQDRLFLKADWGIWNDTSSLSEEKRALHQEYRFGVGVYVQPWNDAALRLFGGTGLSLVTASGTLITLADPLWLGVEYHFPHWALKAEFRLPEILGYRRDRYELDLADFSSYGLVGILLKW